MTVLITGGAGFIGSHLVRWWLAHRSDEAVVVVDLLTYAGNQANLADLAGHFSFVCADIGDTDTMADLLREHRVDLVVNAAAESHNSLAVVDPARFFRTNVLGTQGLLEAARQAGVPRFHHVSTCEVYGDLALDAPSGDAFTEGSPYRPRTPYNASKAGGDHAVRAYHETYGLATTITVGANTYGPHQFPEKVVPLFITRALDYRPLPLYASVDHRREWIHVEDHCAAIAAAAERGRPGRTYHVGSGEERMITEVADAVLAATGRPPSLKTTVADRPGHDRRYLLDSSRIRRELGWAPTIGFDHGLATTAAWYGTHRHWWEPLLERLPVAEAEAWTDR